MVLPKTTGGHSSWLSGTMTSWPHPLGRPGWQSAQRQRVRASGGQCERRPHLVLSGHSLRELGRPSSGDKEPVFSALESRLGLWLAGPRGVMLGSLGSLERLLDLLETGPARRASLSGLPEEKRLHGEDPRYHSRYQPPKRRGCLGNHSGPQRGERAQLRIRESPNSAQPHGRASK